MKFRKINENENLFCFQKKQHLSLTSLKYALRYQIEITLIDLSYACKKFLQGETILQS